MTIQEVSCDSSVSRLAFSMFQAGGVVVQHDLDLVCGPEYYVHSLAAECLLSMDSESLCIGYSVTWSAQCWPAIDHLTQERRQIRPWPPTITSGSCTAKSPSSRLKQGHCYGTHPIFPKTPAEQNSPVPHRILSDTHTMDIVPIHSLLCNLTCMYLGNLPTWRGRVICSITIRGITKTEAIDKHIPRNTSIDIGT